MSEEKKQKLKEYQKNYCKAKIVFYLTFFDFFHFIVLEKRGKKVLSFVKKILSKTNFIYTKNQLVLMKWILKEQSCQKKNRMVKDSCKYFIGYICKGTGPPLPLCIKLPKTNAYAKYFDKNNNCINLLVKDEEILKKCNEIWNKLVVY